MASAVECSMCGNCCRAIPMRRSIDELAKFLPVQEIEFIRAHWHKIEKPEPPPNKFSADFYSSAIWCACDLLDTETGLCTIQDNKPVLCQEYPVDRTKEFLISDKCVFISESENG